MRFCKYCGSQVPDNAEQCPECNKYIGPKSKPADMQTHQETQKKEAKATLSKNKYLIGLAAIVVVVLVVVLCLVNSGKCKADGCKNKVISGMSYCYNHKCAVPDCDNERLSFSNYCYSHYLLYDDNAITASTPEVTSDELKISGVKLTTEKYSSYTVAEGTITNNSDQTVSFVKIKGSFIDRSGNVVDTDWTYAVDSAGLAPGESCTWRMSVKKNHSIEKCSVSILDFDY